MSENDETASARFLAAYNAIDKKLRRRYGFSAKESFSVLVRKIAGQNYIVKKYEDDLIEYARLRNAIVHSESGEPIAEPHIEIVEKIERLCGRIIAPPAALAKVACRRAETVRAEDTLKTVIFLIAEKHRSHLPVISGGAVAGIVNGKILVGALAGALKRGKNVEKYIQETTVGEIIAGGNQGMRTYEILPKSASIETAAGLFDKNRKLKLILITDNGTAAGKILGVATVADIVEFNNLLNE